MTILVYISQYSQSEFKKDLWLKTTANKPINTLIFDMWVGMLRKWHMGKGCGFEIMLYSFLSGLLDYFFWIRSLNETFLNNVHLYLKMVESNLSKEKKNPVCT